ncbi:hypothetical protein U9M48_013686, partial [Paspalum notatum var. saurae]
YQNAHKIAEIRPRIKDEAHWPNWPGRPTHSLGRPTRARPTMAQPSRPTRGLAARPTNRQDQASNVSKGRKCTKSRIHHVNNLREEQNGQCKADTWSPDLLQGRPTYPRRNFSHATTVLTANRHEDARSSCWSAKAVDRVVARPRARSADLPPRSADH